MADESIGDIPDFQPGGVRRTLRPEDTYGDLLKARAALAREHAGEPRRRTGIRLFVAVARWLILLSFLSMGLLVLAGFVAHAWAWFIVLGWNGF